MGRFEINHELIIRSLVTLRRSARPTSDTPVDSVDSGFIDGTPAQLAAATANDDSSHYYIAMAIREGRLHYLVLAIRPQSMVAWTS